jgi:hypothetical protein
MSRRETGEKKRSRDAWAAGAGCGNHRGRWEFMVVLRDWEFKVQGSRFKVAQGSRFSNFEPGTWNFELVLAT